MIAPHKYLDIGCSPLAVAAVILSELKLESILRYDDLLHAVIDKKGIKAKVNFLPALHLLYLLGKVEYRQNLDSIEFLP